MTRYIVAAVLGVIYVVAAGWFVRTEGQAYRATLRASRASAPSKAVDSGKPVRVEPEPVVIAKPQVPEPVPPAPRIDVPAERPAPVVDVPTAEPQPPSAPKEQEKPALVKAEPLPTPPVEPDKPQPKAKAPDPFWDLPELKEVWDLDHLTTADEVRLGRALNQLVLQFNPPDEDAGNLQRIEDVAAPFLKNRDRKDIEYTFTVLDSDAVCAFSHPGGYIYVCRGLFRMIGADDDSTLEFALGHEIAHVDMKHALKCLNDPGVRQLKKGTLTSYYFLIAPLAYLPEQEFEADLWVYKQMLKLKRSRYEVLSFLRKLENYASRNGFPNGRKTLPEYSPVENHYRGHIATRTRLKKLQEITTPAQAAPK